MKRYHEESNRWMKEKALEFFHLVRRFNDKQLSHVCLKRF